MSVYGADSCSGRLRAAVAAAQHEHAAGSARGTAVARYYIVAGVAVPEGAAGP